MCPPTGFDSVTADSQLGCADLLHGLVFPLVVIKQRRRQRLQACRSDYQRAHHLPAIAADSLLAAMQEFGCPGGAGSVWRLLITAVCDAARMLREGQSLFRSAPVVQTSTCSAMARASSTSMPR